MSKVIQALEKRYPGSKVVDIHIDGMYDEDEIMVTVVNRGPPRISPEDGDAIAQAIVDAAEPFATVEEWSEFYGLPDTLHPDANRHGFNESR